MARPPLPVSLRLLPGIVIASALAACGGGNPAGGDPVRDLSEGRDLPAVDEPVADGPIPDGRPEDRESPDADADPCTGGEAPGIPPVCGRWTCTPGGGWHIELLDGGPCDDDDLCTLDDACVAGTCRGVPKDCADADPCTRDACRVGECVHEVAEDTPACTLAIVLESPEPAARRPGEPAFEIRGHVTGPRPVEAVAISLDGVPRTDPVPLDGDGAFRLPANAVHGLNTVAVAATDDEGRHHRAVRSFLWSGDWIPPGAGGGPSRLPRSGAAFLSAEAIDDHDASDLDDIATLAGRALAGVDLAFLAPSPAATGTLGGCAYAATVDRLRVSTATLLVTPGDGALDVQAMLQGVTGHATLAMTGNGCQDLSSDVTASSLRIALVLAVAPGPDGAPVARADAAQAWVSDDFALSPCEPFCAGVTPLRWVLEGTLRDALATKVPEALNPVLSTEQAVSIPVPALVEGGAPTTLPVRAGVRNATVSPDGLRVILDASTDDPEAGGVSDGLPGSIGRGPCPAAADVPGMLAASSPIEAALSDDLLNRLAWTLWRAGALHFPVTATDLAGQGIDLASYGVSNLAMDVDAGLPPVIESCDRDGWPVALQAGEVRMTGSLDLLDVPLSLDLSLHLSAPATVQGGPGDATPSLVLVLERPTVLDAEVRAWSSPDPIVTRAVVDDLVDALLAAASDRLAGRSLTLALPALDPASLVPGLPAGTSLLLRPLAASRAAGATALESRLEEAPIAADPP